MDIVTISWIVAGIAGSAAVIAAIAASVYLFNSLSESSFDLGAWWVKGSTDPWWWISIIVAIIPTLIAAIVALAGLFFSYQSSDPDSVDPIVQSSQQRFLYNQQSRVRSDLLNEADISSFYRAIGLEDDGKRMRLTPASSCVNESSDSSGISQFDFSACESGTYYTIASSYLEAEEQAEEAIAQARQGIQKGRSAEKGIDQAVDAVSQGLSEIDDRLNAVRSAIDHHGHKMREHQAAEARDRNNLRNCAWWDVGCHGHNGWLWGWIEHHHYWQGHHDRERQARESELASVRAEQQQLMAQQQQLSTERTELVAKTQKLERLVEEQRSQRITNQADDSISIPVDALGDAVHWVSSYEVTLTAIEQSTDQPADQSADQLAIQSTEVRYALTVDCPLIPAVCEQMQLQAHYPLLMQSRGWGSVQTATVEDVIGSAPEGLEGANAIAGPITGKVWTISYVPHPLLTLSNSSTQPPPDNAVSLAIYYNQEDGSGPGSGIDDPQIIQHADGVMDGDRPSDHDVFNDVKYAGALKGRWHRGDMEVDEREIVRWQRLESSSTGRLQAYGHPELIIPAGHDGIGYEINEGPGRLVDMLLVDIDEDGLDELLTIYSDGTGTQLRYRRLADIESQSDIDDIFGSGSYLADAHSQGVIDLADDTGTQLRYRRLADVQSQNAIDLDVFNPYSDEREIDLANVVNIDRVQLIQGTHHVHNRQDGVHYLLLHSVTDSKVYPVALVQPKLADLNNPFHDSEYLRAVPAEAVEAALAVDAIWLNDPHYGVAGGDQLLLSWLETGEEREKSAAIYVDRGQLEVQQRLLELTTIVEGDTVNYQLGTAVEIIDDALEVRFNTYGLTQALEGCAPVADYSYRGHLSLQLINDPQTDDDQLGAVVSVTNTCELVRAMDPYHRGKSDRLLVQNDQYPSIPMNPEQWLLEQSNYYLDYRDGFYQPNTDDNEKRDASYQYPFSVTLQSQNLSFDETDERYLRQKMLRDYCEAQTINDKYCLHHWLKNALETDSGASEYSDCDSHKVLNTAMINCIRTIVLATLNKLPDGTSWESSTHKFSYTNAEGNHTLKRIDLSTENTDHIDINRLFDQLFHTLSLTQQGANNQFNNPSVGQSIWTDLVATTINTIVSPAHAGAEIAACLALGPLAIDCAAVDLILSVAMVALAASKTCEWGLGGVVGDYLLCPQHQTSPLTAEQKVAQHTPSLIEPEYKKAVFEKTVQEAITGLSAAEACTVLGEMAILDPEPGSKVALYIVDTGCWLSLTVVPYFGEQQHFNYWLEHGSQTLSEQDSNSGNQTRSQMLGSSEGILISVTDDGIKPSTMNLSSAGNSQVKICKDNTDLCVDNTLRIRALDDGSLEVISLSTGEVNPWWYGQIGENEMTGSPQLNLSITVGNNEKILTYDVIKKDKQGNPIFGLSSLKTMDYEGTQHFLWTYNAYGQVISIVVGTENASEEFTLLSSWAFYHQLMKDALQPVLDFVVRYDNHDLNGGVDMQPSELYRFEYAQQEGHQHQLQEIEKIVNGKVAGYLKLGVSASKAKPLGDIPCDNDSSQCYSIDQFIKPNGSRTYRVPSMVYSPHSAMWLPVLGFTVYSDGIQLKTLSLTSPSICPTQYDDISAPGNDLWHVNDFSQLQIPQPLQKPLSDSLKRAQTYYFKGTQIALASMAKALLNQTTLREGMDKIVEEMQSQSIEFKNQDGQWANVSTLFNTTAIESDAESETQNEFSNQADSFNQGITNLAELLGLQSPQINSPIGEIDDNTSVEQLADLLCPVSASPNDDGSPDNDYEEGECEFEEHELDKDQSETGNLQADIPSLPLDVLMEYVERDPEGFRDEMQRVIKELEEKLSELIKVNGSPLSFASDAHSILRSSGRRRLGHDAVAEYEDEDNENDDKDNENNESSNEKIPLITFYPLDFAVAAYMKIPHNTVFDEQNRRRDSIRIVLDYQENMDEIRPAEAPIFPSWQWFAQWLPPRVDGTNFYKVLFVVRPFEYKNGLNIALDVFVVLDAKQSILKGLSPLKDPFAINPEEGQPVPATERGGSLPPPRWFHSHELRSRSDVVWNLGKFIRLENKEVNWNETLMLENKLSYELTLGEEVDPATGGCICNKYKCMNEFKIDVGSSRGLQVKNDSYKSIGTLAYTSGLSIFGYLDTYFPKVAIVQQSILAELHVMLGMLHVINLGMSGQMVDEGDEFSSFYVVFAPIQPVLDTGGNDYSFEGRGTLSLKLNISGNMDPRTTDVGD